MEMTKINQFKHKLKRLECGRVNKTKSVKTEVLNGFYTELQAMRKEPLIRSRAMERAMARMGFQIAMLDVNGSFTNVRELLRSRAFTNVQTYTSLTDMMVAVNSNQAPDLLLLPYHAQLDKISPLIHNIPSIVVKVTNQDEIDKLNSWGIDCVLPPYSDIKLKAKIEEYYNDFITDTFRNLDFNMKSAVKTVLIVDQDVEYASNLFKVLNLDYEVVIASSIEEATYILENSQINLLITEVQFDKGNGANFGEYLKSQNKQTSLIYVTNASGKHKIPQNTICFDKSALISEIRTTVKEVFEIQKENRLINLMIESK